MWNRNKKTLHEKQRTLTKGQEDTSETTLKNIIKGLGGIDNICEIRCCTTRLRILVSTGELVNRQILKSTGATGVLLKNRDIQIIYGKSVHNLMNELKVYMKKLKQKNGENQEEIVFDDEDVLQKMFTPIEGDILDIRNIFDAEGTWGKAAGGIAIYPQRGEVRSPFNGQISHIFKDGYGLSVVSDTGVQVVINVGKARGELPKEQSKIYISEGQSVRKGQLLLEFDLEKLEEQGYKLMCPILLFSIGDNNKIHANYKERATFEHVAMVILKN